MIWSKGKTPLLQVGSKKPLRHYENNYCGSWETGYLSIYFNIHTKDVLTYHESTYSNMFIMSLFRVDKNWKQSRCPSQKSENNVLTLYIVYYSAFDSFSLSFSFISALIFLLYLLKSNLMQYSQSTLLWSPLSTPS